MIENKYVKEILDKNKINKIKISKEIHEKAKEIVENSLNKK